MYTLADILDYMYSIEIDRDIVESKPIDELKKELE